MSWPGENLSVWAVCVEEHAFSVNPLNPLRVFQDSVVTLKVPVRWILPLFLQSCCHTVKGGFTEANPHSFMPSLHPKSSWLHQPLHRCKRLAAILIPLYFLFLGSDITFQDAVADHISCGSIHSATQWRTTQLQAHWRQWAETGVTK